MELSNFRECGDFHKTYVVKCVLLGRFGVGKSTIAYLFSNGKFDSTLTSTVGIDFVSKTVDLSTYNQQIKLQIWDTAGQEKYQSIVKSYLRDVYIAYIVFDITDRESWNEIDKWKNMLNKTGISFVPRIVLVGTKYDRMDKNENHVTEDEIITKSNEWECNYYILSKSSSSAINVRNMFYIETEKFHKDVLYNYINGREIPYGILKDKELINDKENTKNCCFN